MAQEYLPAPSNVRLADLMKKHNISQPELAKEIGCSKSTISRFISGAKGTLTHQQVLKIARLFNVSTDFLLGETNIPDRKNYDIAELGLSVEAAKNLYTGRVNAEVVNLLLENARFAELTYRIAQYFDDTFASGIAAQNAMLTTLSTLPVSYTHLLHVHHIAVVGLLFHIGKFFFGQRVVTEKGALADIIQIAHMNEGFFCERRLFLHSAKFLFGLGEGFVGLGGAFYWWRSVTFSYTAKKCHYQ